MPRRPRPARHGIPHTAIIYPDLRTRNQMVNRVLTGTQVAWSGATIMSFQPDVDTRFFGRRARAARPHQRLPATYDVRELLSRSPDPSDEIIQILKAAREKAPAASPPVMIGTWPHLCYDSFDAVLRTERRLNEESLSPICCYRQEGFCSLEPKQILEVFEAHRRTYFGSTIFETAG